MPFTRTRREPFELQFDLGTINSGTVEIDLSKSKTYKLIVGGNLTIDLTSFAAPGYYNDVEIELVNGGAHTITWPTIRWLVGDGTNSTTFGDMGVTLQSSGTNHVILWSTDGGATIWGTVI